EGAERLEERHVDALVARTIDLTAWAADVGECCSSCNGVRNEVCSGLAVGILGGGVGDIACLGVSKGAGVVPVLHGANLGRAGDPGVGGRSRTSALVWVADPD